MELGKRRKVDYECRNFNEGWKIKYFFIQADDKALCLICRESVAVLKGYNLKRHYDAKHSSSYSHITGADRAQLFEVFLQDLYTQQPLFKINAMNGPAVMKRRGRKRKTIDSTLEINPHFMSVDHIKSEEDSMNMLEVEPPWIFVEDEDEDIQQQNIESTTCREPTSTSKKTWTDEETLQLISLYEEKESLWDSKHDQHRNRELKMSILEEFASKFNCGANEIQRKINNLRNQVSHELLKLRKLKNMDGADISNYRKWKFFNALQFIVPGLTRNTTLDVSNYHENSEISQNELTQEIKKARPYKKTSHEDDKILKKAIEIITKTKDDYDRFGEYVALELKTLKSDYHRGLLKSEIRKAITNISDMDEREYWSSASDPLTASVPSSASDPLSKPSTDDDNDARTVKNDEP